jgi:hypothetical protein
MARQLRGAVRFGAGEVTLEDVEGTLAGGRASGHLELRQSADGLEARGRFALLNGDAAAILPTEGKPVIAGRLGLQAEFQGSGLSPASLIGSLKGTGLITLEDGLIAALDPKAFNAAIRAADQGPLDVAKIRDVVATVLDGGHLAVPRLDAPVTINAGQARIGQTVAQGQSADLLVVGNSDLADASIDARLTLFGPIVDGAGTTRPEILVTLKGPLGAAKRTVDVSMLSGFLMLRSVERQSKQIDSIEAERHEAERREADRKEADKKEADRRAAETRPIAAPLPPTLPETNILDESPLPRTTRPRPAAVPPARAPAAERAPVLPPPLNIGPAPGVSGKSGQTSRPAGETAKGGQLPTVAPPAPRSALDVLFGVQR